MKKLMTCGTVLAFALAAKAEITFDPDCVLYYDFETLDSEGRIVNLVKPGTMDGTVVTKTLTPELAEDSPARLRQSMKAADYETSESCLVNSIESADSRQNGYIECTPSDLDWFSKTNFTVECFFKTENMTQTQTPIFFRRGGPGIQVWLGTFGTAGTVGLGISTDTETTLYKTISAFTAGTWNHVALVVDQTGATKTAKTYFNGKLMETVSLSSNLAAEYKDSVSDQSGSWYVAGAKAGNSFDGKVDSMRVTLRALAPEEFLTDRPYASGSTITRISFEDETPDAPAAYGTLRQSKCQGSPAYSSDVPNVCIRDGEGGELIERHNAKSISFPDTVAQVLYGGHNGTLPDIYHFHSLTGGQYRTAGTIEFWMKSSQTDAGWEAGLLKSTANTNTVSGTANYNVLLIRFNGRHQLRFEYNSSVDGSKIITNTGDVNVLDGNWHHIAFTFQPAPADPSKMVATGYVDRKVVGTQTCNGHMLFENNGYFDLRLGGGYVGLIDELRISDTALTSSQFLRAEPPAGLVIVFK